MKVPYAWLREHCAPETSLPDLVDRLTLIGTKVEALHKHGPPSPDGFVVGHVLTAEQHPDADRLRVCTVDVGDEEGPQQIVCGAPNVAAGQTVAVVRPGAVMPGGMRIKKAKLRGVESRGMILSEDELQLAAERAGGILVLPDGLVPGTPLADVLPFTDDVIEFEITPNRPDCLGVYGIAREVHVATGAPLGPAPWADDPGSAGDVAGVTITVEAPDLCPRFTARVFEGVTIGPSPTWLKARLMAAGQRPINNVVDITNYAMLLTGHPLHAFDLDRVAGGTLNVRRARDGEKVTTLDDVERTLDGEMLLIEDADGPTSIAGVMGGARSEVHDGTTRVLMEVASWIGPNIMRTSNALGLRSEASGRFEKGLAPEQAMEAQVVATQLMLELTGASVAPGTIDVGGDALPGPSVLALRDERVQGLLGQEITLDEQRQTLLRLGFAVDGDGPLSVTVPAFRRLDVTREADLVEEVGRFALDRLPATLPKRRPAANLSVAQRLRRRALDALVGRGLHEVVGWSFTEPGVADKLRLGEDDPRRRFVTLQNPMSEDHAVLRTTLLGSVLDAAEHNVARGMPDLRLFEVGAVYAGHRQGASSGRETVASPTDPPPLLPDEHRSLLVLLHGAVQPASWGAPKVEADVFVAKGVLEALAHAVRADVRVEPIADPEPFLHPGRAGTISVAGVELGWIGELHPRVAAAWDLGRTACFELHLDRLLDHAVAIPEYRDLTSFPSVRQDLAVVVPREVTAQQVLDVARQHAAAAEVFDVFSGAQVGEGRTSLAVHLEFRAADRTLTDEEVARTRGKIVAALEALGGELRG